MNADAAVILGYALKSDGTPTPTLLERVAAGATLFDAVKTPAFHRLHGFLNDGTMTHEGQTCVNE
jgi:hypothetical protein